MTSETITLIANIALAVSAIIALVFGIVQVKSAGRDRQERLTLEALRNFNTREFSELMNYVTAHNIPLRMRTGKNFPCTKDYYHTVCTGNGIARHSCRGGAYKS